VWKAGTQITFLEPAITLCDPNDLNTNLLRANGFKPPSHLCVLFRFLADSSIPVALFKRLMDFDINKTVGTPNCFCIYNTDSSRRPPSFLTLVFPFAVLGVVILLLSTSHSFRDEVFSRVCCGSPRIRRSCSSWRGIDHGCTHHSCTHGELRVSGSRSMGN
jgi:hypothetical protein